MDLLFELFEDMPRQGPGTDASTQRAYSLINGLPSHPHILDIGSGSGMQSVVLAECSSGSVTALDIYTPFLKTLRTHAFQRGFSDRISTVQGSMFALPFADNTFDLIWSEGAIYLMGFEDGIQSWDRLLKPGGTIVVSELTWLKKYPPEEVADFWNNAYPSMNTVEENVQCIKRCGYSLRGFFTLPEEGWWENFYLHLAERISTLKTKYAHDSEALAVLASEEKEIGFYERYSEWYGYVFYIITKTPSSIALPD